MKCDVCGHEFDGVDAAFCIYCGRRIIKPLPVSNVESGITEKLDQSQEVKVSEPVYTRRVSNQETSYRVNTQPDSYYQKLPAIIDEMRSNESQVVKPIQWLLSCIMLWQYSEK